MPEQAQPAIKVRKGRENLPVLTSLRFPAAFAIVLFHSVFSFGWPEWSWQNLSSGVSFFYVLSGFILYYNYVDLKDRGYFWAARFARIWPIHVATCAAALLFFPFYLLNGHASWPITLPCNLLLVHAWLPYLGGTASYNGVSWSLSVEAFFYLTFPWILPFMKKQGIWPPLLVSFFVGLCAAVAARIVFPAQGFIPTTNPLCRIFEFVLGMSTCQIWLTRPEKIRSHNKWTAIEGATLLIVALAVFVPMPLLKALGLATPLTSWLLSAFYAIFFAGLIWTFAHEAGALSKALSARALVFLGEISFALYMCHQMIWRGLSTYAGEQRWSNGWLFTVYVASALLTATLLFYLVENPARHAIVRSYTALRKRSAARKG